ncbi:Dabb family protein [Caldicellulosiruptoraceae bacterium PP1]
MIKHIVMWKLKDEFNGKDKSELLKETKERLESLYKNVPGIVSLQVGINKDGLYGNYDLVLITDFENSDALKDYQEHPYHLEVAKYISDVRIERACVDFEY